MTAKSLNVERAAVLAFVLAVVAIGIAVAGCFLPTQNTADDHTTALIIDKTDAYVTISVDADESGSLEIWCKNKCAGTLYYSSGNHVYTQQFDQSISAEKITALEIRYR